MSYEVPYDDVRELQISLRRECGLSSYNSEDPSLPILPTLDTSIAELDPSPAYLRCKHCKGRLLRGINSIICAFCGKRQFSGKDGEEGGGGVVCPHPIKFLSTTGSRWFLQFLDLDGSELVAASADTKESNKGLNVPQNEIPLSDVLDLEIRWPSEPEKLEASIPDKTPAQRLNTLNFSGADLDNFFGEAKVEPASASTEGQVLVTKHEDTAGSNAFQGHANLSFFENVQPTEAVAGVQPPEPVAQVQPPEAVASVQPSETVAHAQPSETVAHAQPSETVAHAQPSETVATSKEDEAEDSFSGWEAEFQAAGSRTNHQDSKLFDPFAGASSVDLSAHMDSVFGLGKEVTTSVSNTNDWFGGELWSTSNPSATTQPDLFKLTVVDKDVGNVGNTDTASMNIDWLQDSQWEARSSSKVADNKTIDEDNNSFDDWNDFTSSPSVQATPVNSSKQGVDAMTPSVGQESGINLLDKPHNGEDFDFGGFSQSSSVSGMINKQNGSEQVNTMQPETSMSDRMAGVNVKDGGGSEKGDVSNGNTSSKADDVDLIMSQMHDLSFMLESNLALPKKTDKQNIDSLAEFS